MSMTREEAIKHLLHDWHINLGCDFVIKPGRLDDFLAALDVALSALRPVSREQVDVVINSLKLRLENNEENGVVYIPKFAVEKMIERLEAIKNG